MSQTDITQHPAPNEQEGERHGAHPHPAHHGHGWMMIACCIPMLVLAIVLVATGVASVGFIFAAVACTLMMAMMMAAMSGGGRGRR